MSKRAISPDKFISLKQAVKLNNKVGAQQAWVFNATAVTVKYSHVVIGEAKAIVDVKAQAYLKAHKAAMADPSNHAECWQVHKMSNFVNNEQVAYLIREGKLFYAPELKGIKNTLLKANISPDVLL